MKQTEEKTTMPQFGDKQIALLERLSNACAVSGNEGEVRKIVLEEIEDKADDIKIDAMGNVIAIKKAKQPGALRVMIAAHMDEVGFMLIQKDSDDNLFRFEKVGGLDNRYLVGKTVWVGPDHIPGVIGSAPIHMVSEEQRAHPIPVESLRIDLGPGNINHVSPGQYAVFATEFKQIGDSLFGKAMDDRLGTATLIELVKNAPDNIELCAAFTVQEEVGLRGAAAAAYSINPDLAFVLDCTPANDMPMWDESENMQYNTRSGYGPAVYIADSATVSDPRLVNHLVETAKGHEIPYQFRQANPGGTDAGAIHRQRGGIPTVSISVPGRYIHSPASIIKFDDWLNSYKLIYHALKGLSPDILKKDR
jgi:endoglucanase